MSDDLNKKIKQITDILGQDTLPDNLKGLLSLLTSAPAKEETPPKTVESLAPREEKYEKSELNDSLEMMQKVRKVMDRLNSNNDPRVSLLTAVRPFLNANRQKKIGDCIKILQMASLTRLMDESDKPNSK